MRNKIAELFIWVSVLALHVAKFIAPSLTTYYMAYTAQEFIKENVYVIELEIDGERTTITPEEIVMSRRDK